MELKDLIIAKAHHEAVGIRVELLSNRLRYIMLELNLKCRILFALNSWSDETVRLRLHWQTACLYSSKVIYYRVKRINCNSSSCFTLFVVSVATRVAKAVYQ